MAEYRRRVTYEMIAKKLGVSMMRVFRAAQVLIRAKAIRQRPAGGYDQGEVDAIAQEVIRGMIREAKRLARKSRALDREACEVRQRLNEWRAKDEGRTDQGRSESQGH